MNNLVASKLRSDEKAEKKANKDENQLNLVQKFEPPQDEIPEGKSESHRSEDYDSDNDGNGEDDSEHDSNSQVDQNEVLF